MENKTIEIPEGYEARIEGNKVILERKESEDEKIRKEIIGFIIWAASRGSVRNDWLQKNRPAEWIAYLERQKEQKPVDSMELSNDGFTPKDIFRFNLASCLYNYGKEVAAKCLGTHILNEELNEYVTMHDVNKVVEDSIELLQRNAMTQKPAEWSEEDEKIMGDIILAIKEVWQDKDANRMIAKLKSLRPQPHWKPSEEQISALERAIVKMHTPDDISILSELRDVLKKLSL